MPTPQKPPIQIQLKLQTVAIFLLVIKKPLARESSVVAARAYRYLRMGRNPYANPILMEI